MTTSASMAAPSPMKFHGKKRSAGQRRRPHIRCANPIEDRTMPQSIPAAAPSSITPALAFMLALSCGLIVANFYYAQPLTGLIGEALELAPAQTGLIVTLTQSGYALGLLLVVPLGDLLENRTLAVASLAAAMAALVAMSTAHAAGMFLAATLLLGVACSSVQILLPYAAHF